MKLKLDPSTLIVIGVVGAACFLSIAVGGLLLQRLASGTTDTLTARNRIGIANSTSSALTAATYTPARKAAAQKYPVQIVDYLNGAVTDLCFEIEQFQQNLNDENLASDKRQIVIQKLQSAQRRAQSVYVNLNTMIKSAQVADADDPLTPEPLLNVASTIDELIKEIQALPTQDAQSHWDIESQPGGAHFKAAVGDLSIWLEQSRDKSVTKR